MTNMAFCKWLRQQQMRLYFATDQTPLAVWNSPSSPRGMGGRQDRRAHEQRPHPAARIDDRSSR
jgi:hypothetical protein